MLNMRLFLKRITIQQLIFLISFFHSLLVTTNACITYNITVQVACSLALAKEQKKQQKL